MTPLRHALALADWFADAAADRFAQGDVYVTPGHACLVYGPLPSDLAPDGLLQSALLVRLITDAADLAAGSLVTTGGVVALHLRTDVAHARPQSLIVATALATSDPASPDIHVIASIEGDNGPTLARLRAV